MAAAGSSTELRGGGEEGGQHGLLAARTLPERGELSALRAERDKLLALLSAARPACAPRGSATEIVNLRHCEV
jgi:hypothetical protein